MAQPQRLSPPADGRSMAERIARAALLAALCARHTRADAADVARDVTHLQRIAWQARPGLPSARLEALQYRADRVAARLGSAVVVTIGAGHTFLTIGPAYVPYEVF